MTEQWPGQEVQREQWPGQEVQAPPAASGRNSALGKIDSFVRGAADMLTFGFADEIAAGADAALNPLLGTGQGGGSFGERYDRNVAAQRATDAADASERWGYRLGGQLGGGVAGGLGLARSGVSFATNLGANGGRLRNVALASAAEGAALGAAHGFGSGEGDLDARIASAQTGAKYGGIAGGIAPVAVAGISSAVRRAVTPVGVSAERQAAANVLRSEGVDLTAGQTSGSRALRFAEGELGGAAAERALERQGEQFTSAALRRAGETAERATPDVMQRAATRIGREFDDLARRNPVHPDGDLASDLLGVARQYTSMVPESARAPIVRNVIEDIADRVRINAPIDGAAYQALRSRLDKAGRASRNDPQLQEALFGIRGALDDAAERSIARTNPSDVGAWQEARRQYRNLLVLERAARGAGENAALGLISPSSLRNAAANQNSRAYVRGQGDFAELARAGEALMKPLPQSGTAPRLRAQNLGAGAMSILGAGGGMATGGPLGAMGGAIVGAAVPRVAGALMMSRPGQAYLMNSVMRGPMDPARRAVANALLSALGAGIAGRLSAP